ncbi:MAG: hypothetical protein ACRBFS_10370 [Aureispira sp.]
MTNPSFFEKCKGIALILGVVLFGTAAILFSTTPAQADAPQTMYATGKYQMTMTCVKDANGDTFWYILAWDTETGRSKLYYGSPKIKKTTAGYSAYQLPSSPL